MPLACPCCKANNDGGPACRRCKADLATLWSVEAVRAALVAQAKALAHADPGAALDKLDAAEAHRAGADIRRLRAACELLRGDFPAAWLAYQRATR